MVFVGDTSIVNGTITHLYITGEINGAPSCDLPMKSLIFFRRFTSKPRSVSDRRGFGDRHGIWPPESSATG